MSAPARDYTLKITAELLQRGYRLLHGEDCWYCGGLHLVRQCESLVADYQAPTSPSSVPETSAATTSSAPRDFKVKITEELLTRGLSLLSGENCWYCGGQHLVRHCTTLSEDCGDLPMPEPVPLSLADSFREANPLTGQQAWDDIVEGLAIVIETSSSATQPALQKPPPPYFVPAQPAPSAAPPLPFPYPTAKQVFQPPGKPPPPPAKQMQVPGKGTLVLAGGPSQAFPKGVPGPPPVAAPPGSLLRARHEAYDLAARLVATTNFTEDKDHEEDIILGAFEDGLSHQPPPPME